MVTHLAVYNSEGCVGRCDAKCSGATHPNCDCICGGRNHGVGEQQAMENTAEMFDDWLDKYSETHEFTEAVVPDIYTTKTKTAVEIARTINANAGYNRVLDVKRSKMPNGNLGWEIAVKPHKSWRKDSSLFPPVKFYVKTLGEVRKQYKAAARPVEQLAIAV